MATVAPLGAFQEVSLPQGTVRYYDQGMDQRSSSFMAYWPIVCSSIHALPLVSSRPFPMRPSSVSPTRAPLFRWTNQRSSLNRLRSLSMQPSTPESRKEGEPMQ